MSVSVTKILEQIGRRTATVWPFYVPLRVDPALRGPKQITPSIYRRALRIDGLCVYQTTSWNFHWWNTFVKFYQKVGLIGFDSVQSRFLWIDGQQWHQFLSWQCEIVFCLAVNGNL